MAIASGVPRLQALTPDSLRELLAPRSGPLLSIYLPTHRAFPEAQQNTVRFRHAVQAASERLLAAGLAAKEASEWTRRLEGFAGDRGALARPLDGLAIFLDREESHAFQLAVATPERVVVGESFEIRPLLRALRVPRRYRVLAVSVNRVALFEGGVRGLSPAALDGVPTSLEDALGSELTEKQLQLRSTRAGGSAPVYHGHAPASDEQQIDLQRYHQALATALSARFLGDDTPLLLAADMTHLKALAAAAKIPGLLPETIPGNPDHLGHAELHARAWPLVQKAITAREREMAAGYERSRNLGKTLEILDDIATAAIAGRVRRLWLEQGRRIAGRLDTGAGRVIEEPGAEGDALDDLAEAVFRRGGEVLIVERERMPAALGAVAELR